MHSISGSYFEKKVNDFLMTWQKWIYFNDTFLFGYKTYNIEKQLLRYLKNRYNLIISRNLFQYSSTWFIHTNYYYKIYIYYTYTYTYTQSVKYFIQFPIISLDIYLTILEKWCDQSIVLVSCKCALCVPTTCSVRWPVWAGEVLLVSLRLWHLVGSMILRSRHTW